MNLSEFKKNVIIITSDEPYSNMWHTQLIYTEFLSKTNRVYFINPPTKWYLKKLFFNSLNIKKENDNLFVINYINKLPSSFSLFQKWNELYNEKKIAQILKKNNYKNILVWHFDSFRNAFSNSFFDSQISLKRIYHVIDPFYNNPLDKYLCQKANKIVVTSPRNNLFYEKYSNKIINIPQCLDIELQKELINAKQIKQSKFKDHYFVLLGTISDDIDFDWILECLKIKEFKLVIIGKVIQLKIYVDKWNFILNHLQVDYLGLCSPAEFYPLLKNASAGLIIYNEEKRIGVRSPLKALNYLISQIPVITNVDCEIPQLINKGICFSDNLNNFNHYVNLVLTKKIKTNTIEADNYLNTISISNAVANIASNI